MLRERKKKVRNSRKMARVSEKKRRRRLGEERGTVSVKGEGWKKDKCEGERNK